MICDYGTTNPRANLIPMVSTHFIWNETYGGIAYEEGTSVVETTDGGFAIAGRTASFGAVVGEDEVWLVRCDHHGVHLWNRTYGGGMTEGGHMDPFHKSVRLESVADGGFLISSHTANYSAGDADGWLIRTDMDGNHLWNYTYGGPDDEYFVESVACSVGGFISSGFTQNITVGNVDGWLIRTDADGNHLWNYTYGSPSFGEIFYNVIEVSNGGFLMSGWAGDFDSIADPDRFTVDFGCWIVRVDADGTHMWNHTYGTVHTATYAAECYDGGFAFIGTEGDTSSDDLDVLLLRTDVGGQQLWNKTYGGSEIEAAFEFAECSDGGFAIFTLTYTDASGVSDGWFIRTDEGGNIHWEQTYGGSGFDQFWAGIETSEGDFVLVGLTRSFGVGIGDMWVVKIPDVSPFVPSPPVPWLLYGVIIAVVVIAVNIAVYMYRKRSHG